MTRWAAWFCLVLAAHGAHAESRRARVQADGVPDGLAERALAADLDQDPVWRALLHLPNRPLARSAAEGGHFFQSPNGATDPGAELRATLAVLEDPDGRVGDEPAACALPARARWLEERLGLPAGHFARGPCLDLAQWRGQIRAARLTLIYADAFLGSPASMFGHTLLRLDPEPSNEGSDLLSHALDFTADTGGEAGPIYLVKGTLGQYPGRFAVNPYYTKLKLYAEWQNRDVWEYPLALEAAELDFLLLHLWELRGVSFPYFFFRENCSYQLVRLLEVVRPGLPIEAGNRLSVAPIDTVRALVDGIGLAGAVAYMPSPARKLRAALSSLSPSEAALAFELARGQRDVDDPALDVTAHPERVLGAAYDALHYWLMTGDVDEEGTRDRAYALLVARSRAGAAFEPPVPPRPDVAPDEGHGTALVALGGGARDGDGFVELRVRPGFHGLLDPEGGFPVDAAIEALDARLRYEPARGRLRLEELSLLSLRSRTAWDALRRPWSWEADVGLRTRLFEDRSGDLDPELLFRAGAGGGITASRLEGRLRATVGLDAAVEAGGAYDGNVAFGPGASLAVSLRTPGDLWKGRLVARGRWFALGDRGTLAEIALEQSLRLSRRTALRADLGYHHLFGASWWDARLMLERYF